MARERLGIARDQLEKKVWDESFGPGNAFTVELAHEHGTSLFTSVGEKALRAEQVAELAIGRALAFHESDAAIDEHLADQLLRPMAIGKGGQLTTTEPSAHTHTQLELLRTFLDVDADITTRDERTYRLEMRGADV